MFDRISDGRTDLVFDYVALGHAANTRVTPNDLSASAGVCGREPGLRSTSTRPIVRGGGVRIG
jgi:hypothetical protein